MVESARYSASSTTRKDHHQKQEQTAGLVLATTRIALHRHLLLLLPQSRLVEYQSQKVLHLMALLCSNQKD